MCVAILVDGNRSIVDEAGEVVEVAEVVADDLAEGVGGQQGVVGEEPGPKLRDHGPGLALPARKKVRPDEPLGGGTSLDRVHLRQEDPGLPRENRLVGLGVAKGPPRVGVAVGTCPVSQPRRRRNLAVA